MASSGKRKRNDDNKDANDLTVDGKNTISVKTYDRGTFSLQVKGSDTIISVKLKIRNMTKIPHDKQALIFNGMVLEGDLITLADYRVKKDSTLTLMRKSSGLVPIIIDCPTGKFRFSMNVELSNTIGKLKAKIPYRVWYLLASKPHDKCKDLVIVSNGIVLDDCCILADFHIKMDSVLTLMHTSTSKTMEIFVKTPAGKTISRDVIATTTIGEVKTAIRWEVDIPEDEQVIIFNEMVLDDSSVVFDFGIKKGSTLTVMRVSKGLMEIFVNIENGKSISFKVKTSDTIGNLKTQISDKVGIPIDKQVLIFNEIILHDCGTCWINRLL